MSQNSHSERYFTKLLIAFASVIGSVLITFYCIFEVKGDNKDWYFWAIVAAFLMCSALYFGLSAFVHKIKSEFSRRQKQKEQQSLTADR